MKRSILLAFALATALLAADAVVTQATQLVTAKKFDEAIALLDKSYKAKPTPELSKALASASMAKADDAIEIPAVVKTRLGLDSEQSWIVLNEANFFAWPGPDLRFLPGMGPETAAYGFLPPTFFRVVLERFMKAARSGTAALVRRSE